MDNYAQIYRLLGLFAGFLVIVAGGYLILAVEPSAITEWSLKYGDFHFQISTRVSGLVLAIVGVVVIKITRS